MKKLIEVNPQKMLDHSILSIQQKIAVGRMTSIDKMIQKHIPKWKISLMKKRVFYAKLFRIFTILEPQPLLESDLVREKLILCIGSSTKPRRIAETIYFVQDQRKLL